MLLPGAVGHELTAAWDADRSQVDVEHPTGHLLVDVVVDTAVTPPRVVRSGVVRTARKLFDGTAFPRAAGGAR
jgi:4-oxalomesaconate tautomerase